MPGQYNIMYPVADLNAMKLNLVAKVTKRIARKKGQHRNSPSHSDLYTDENPKGTIHGLKFATVQDAKDSVKKIENSGTNSKEKIILFYVAGQTGDNTQVLANGNNVRNMDIFLSKCEKEFSILVIFILKQSILRI